jgi:hypothetical protein
MTDREELQRQILNVGRNGPRSKAWDDLCAVVKTHLADLGPHERLSTRELITELEWDDLEHTNQALWQMRKQGGIPEAYWERDGDRRWMGHPLILWRKPVLPKGEVDVSIF